jgi:hypothetical protein
MQISIPFSKSQWDLMVDSQIYGSPWGKELGENEYIQKEIEKLGYKKFDYITMDEKTTSHLIEVSK